MERGVSKVKKLILLLFIARDIELRIEHAGTGNGFLMLMYLRTFGVRFIRPASCNLRLMSACVL